MQARSLFMWLVIAFAAVTKVVAYPSYWKDYYGCNVAPSADHNIMANHPVLMRKNKVSASLILDVADNSYIPGTSTRISIHTSPSDHLLAVSSGVLSAPTSDGQVICDGKMIAWSGDTSTERGANWTSPARGGKVAVTLAAAEWYGPVNLYILELNEASDQGDPSRISMNAFLEAHLTRHRKQQVVDQAAKSIVSEHSKGRACVDMVKSVEAQDYKLYQSDSDTSLDLRKVARQVAEKAETLLGHAMPDLSHKLHSTVELAWSEKRGPGVDAEDLCKVILVHSGEVTREVSRVDGDIHLGD